MRWVHWGRYARPIERIWGQWKHCRYRLNAANGPLECDCVNFVCGVLSELRQEQPYRPEAMSGDAYLHVPAKANALVLELIRHYDCSLVTSDEIETGDIAIVRPGPLSGPMHAMMASHKPHQLIESSPGGARMVSLLSYKPETLVFYRPNKEAWIS